MMVLAEIHPDMARIGRFALLETLKTGVAPFRAATYYLDEGMWAVDTITKELLVVVGRRLVGATQRRIIELADGLEPRRQAGWGCGFCRLGESCPGAAGRVSGGLGFNAPARSHTAVRC